MEAVVVAFILIGVCLRAFIAALDALDLLGG